MIKKTKTFGIISLILICLLGSISPVSQALLKDDTPASLDEVCIIVRCQSKTDNEHIVHISYETTRWIITEIKNIQTKLNNQEISELEYLQDFLSIFQTIGILSSNYSMHFFQRFVDELQETMLSLHHMDLIQRMGKTMIDAYEPVNQFERSKDLPVHIGRGTIIGSISFGNYLVKRIIPFKPYGFHEVFSKKLFLDYNLSSVFSYASACIWTPGPRGHHVLYSFYPHPSLQSFSKKIFVDKAIGGVFLLGTHISLEAFSNDGKNILFDATIGVYGADLMIGFGR